VHMVDIRGRFFSQIMVGRVKIYFIAFFLMHNLPKTNFGRGPDFEVGRGRGMRFMGPGGGVIPNPYVHVWQEGTDTCLWYHVTDALK
jgi:hypothetical protein